MALTHILGEAGIRRDPQRHWWPRDVLQQFELSADQFDSHGHEQRFASMVRLLASRVELVFFEGSALANYLGFDGLRVLKSLFSVHWRLLNRIKENPLGLWHAANRLPRPEWLALRFQHWLGTEGSGNPLVVAMKPPHH
jgi:phytoene/squalene synthetase